MSQENVENLRAFLEPANGVSWDANLLADWQTRLSLLDPDVIYEDATMFDETFHGHAGVIRAWQRWSEAFAGTRLELVQILGDGDKAVSTHDFQATAHLTGIEFKGTYAYVWEFRDGKVVRYRSVADPEQALIEAKLTS
jgi:ketosteroid isomerase-like protein